MLLWFFTFWLVRTGALSVLPYNPTTALVSSNSSAVYIFAPSNDRTTFQLSAINLTSTILTSNIQPLIIASTLPFTPQPTIALIVTIDAEDKVHLIAGECIGGVSATKLYTITPSDESPQWLQISVNNSGIQPPAANGGINFLSGSMQFNKDVYIFGGMCPNNSSLTVDNWQGSASYSDTLLEVSSNGTISQLDTREPPTQEAGFSVTPLPAAYGHGSPLNAIQQTFVLIGGHTRHAFINTSYTALFSLPEESWSFISVEHPSNLTSIERSGHAATLSSDGRRIFIFGGWVGDIATAARPQFLILEISEPTSNGTSGPWSWNEQAQIGSAPDLYGHSMVSIPGEILMVAGGYTIDNETNTNVYFFNTSSNTWLTVYNNPNTRPAPQQEVSANNSLKIGLSVGLCLGLGLLFMLILCLWVGRRKIRDHKRVEIGMISKEPGVAVHEEPGVAIHDETGVAIREEPGIVVDEKDDAGTFVH